MSRKNREKVSPDGVCSDYELADSGVIKVARCFTSLDEPYQKVKKYPDYLKLVNHDMKLEKRDYEKEIDAEEQKFNGLTRRLKEQKISLVVVLQGRDGAGKTGASKKIVEALDFDWRVFRIVPVGAPTEEERNQPYLLRFFEDDRMPAFGEVRVFDRSWAEDVLVVPVMNLASKEHVRHCYPEIRTMEWLLRRSRSIVVKIWLDITKDEQQRRFEDRQKAKPWKFQDSDVTARKHWDDYTKWGNRLFYWTGTEYPPWFIVPADDKRFSRVITLKILNEQIERELQEPFRPR